MRINKCILGSQSPRRQQLMEIMGFPFEVRVSDVEEDFPADMEVRSVAGFLADKKAQALLPGLAENEVLITADSTVICSDKIFNKPSNHVEAVEMLQSLSGKKHEVVTGVWIGNHNNHEVFSVSTFVEFSHITPEEMNHYIEHYKPFDKAGGYGIQDWIGTTLVKAIQGSYTNVMGLPTHEIYIRLRNYFS